MDFHGTDGFPETAIRLISGKVFDFEHPEECEAITVHDVAHALARTTRYSGHIGMVYSVAAHAMLVAGIVKHHYNQPELALAALHHDDVEFVTQDWPSPLKRYVKAHGFDYKRELERPIEWVICKHLGLSLDDLHAGVIKDADRLAFVAEATALKPDFNPSDQGFDDIDPDLVQEMIGQLPIIGVSMAEQGFFNAHYMLQGLTPPPNMGLVSEDDEDGTEA